MFPLTHIHCAKRITGGSDPAVLCGAIFPDIPVTGVIGWDRMKNGTGDFSDHAKRNDPDLEGFANGLLLHEDPNGIDRFVHGENGFAYAKGRQLIEHFKEFFPDDPLGTAHSFIEFAVEMLVVERNPGLKEDLLAVLAWSSENADRIARVFSGFFGLDEAKASKAIGEFGRFLSMMDFSSRERAIAFYAGLTNRLRKSDLSPEAVGGLLKRSIEAVQSDYESFLDKAIAECRLAA